MQPQLLCTCHVLESDELHLGPNSVAKLKKAYILPEDCIYSYCQPQKELAVVFEIPDIRNGAFRVRLAGMVNT